MNIIYSRVSTVEQNVTQQTDFLKSHYSHDEVYEDKYSGKTMEREQFNLMKSKLRTGDTVYFYDVSRIGRDTSGVLAFCEDMKKLGVSVVIYTLDSMDITSSTGKLMLTMLAGLAEMQRTEMLEKQRIGIDRAKTEGKYKGKQVSQDSIDELERVEGLLKNSEMSIAEALRLVGMNKSKFYRLRGK